MLRLDDFWVWDSWSVHDGARHHLFFLKAPRDLADPQQRHTHAVIGHAVSDDLVDWEILPDALHPRPGGWDDLALWTGSVVRGDDGVWRMYYSALSSSEGLAHRDQRIGLAASEDLVHWRRVLDAPLLDPDPRWYQTLPDHPARSETWRDPFVLRDPAGDGWHMLICARAAGAARRRDGVLAHARSADLVHWELGPPVTRPGGFGQTEVAQVRVLDGTPLLVFTCHPDEQDRPQACSTWWVSGPALTGPFDLARARPFQDEPRLFAAPLIQRASGTWTFLGFRRRDPEDGDELAIVDPIDVTLRHSGLRRVLVPESLRLPDLTGLRSPEGWLYASSLPVTQGDPGRFHALFGRDSLISALALLPVAPDIASATLRALAARQGTREDPVTLEAPGKIGHEFRDQPPPSFLDAGWPDPGPFHYYATADATAWFLVLLAALDDPSLAGELGTVWRAAATWLTGALDRGGGFVRHERSTALGGLVQQGWRDTNDPSDEHGGGILAPDGSVPPPCLADADTQAVTYAALQALARLDPTGGWSARAADLRERISVTFTADVMAVAPDGVPIGGAGSQLGWLLWADALDTDHAAQAAARLCEPDILTPYGLRTLSARARVFGAHTYHRGSVWPFDCWLGWGGLRAAGRLAEAEAVRAGVLEAVRRLDGAPELYAVTAGDGRLERTPAANHRQAWTVAAIWALQNGWDGRAP